MGIALRGDFVLLKWWRFLRVSLSMKSRNPFSPVKRFVLILSTFIPWLDAEEVVPPSPPIQRIVFASCAKQDKPDVMQVVWKEILSKNPELFLFIGDNIYGDTLDMVELKSRYDLMGVQEGYQKLRKICPVLATWDDHDYGLNDSGEWHPKKIESQRVMLDFFNEPADSPRRQRKGIYESYFFGPEGKRVQVILLDCRYFKSKPIYKEIPKDEMASKNLAMNIVPNNNPATTILGVEQWSWLEEQLKKPAEVRIIASSIQVVADEKGMESWGNFPHERKHLYEVIARSGANGILFISGDVHFAELSKTPEGPYPLYDFTSSGMTHTRPPWGSATNSFRVDGKVFTDRNFGMIQVDWTPPVPKLVLQVFGLDGKLGFEHTIPLDELKHVVR